MEYIIVGKIINSHGIMGEVKVYPYTDDINRFSNLVTVYIGGNKLEAEVQNWKYHKGLVILKFKGFNNINEIIPFKNDFLYIDIKNRIELPKDHYFIYELIGCRVLDLKGNHLGHITNVLQYGSNDVYVIEDKINNREYLIPAVKEFIKEVNVANKKLIISPIEGMVE